MSSIQVSLPVPAGDGVGAGVDTSALGAKKTITVGAAFDASVTIEISQDGGTTWAPIASFTKDDEKAVDFAAQQMRVRIDNFTSGTPDVDVGAEAATGNFSAVNVPAGAGDGTALDVSQFGLYNTITCNVDPGTTLNIEVSQDNTTWTPVASFTKAGQKTVKFSAQWMRVSAVGTHAVTVIAIGATNESSGGAGANLFGNGSSGDVTVAGTSTLTGDAYYNNLTITGTLNTGGFRVFVKNTLTIDGGVLANNGNPGGSPVGAVAGTAGAAAAGGTLQPNLAGGAGGVAGVGVVGVASPVFAGTTGTNGGAGGAGTSGAGGAGGVATAVAATQSQTPNQLPVAYDMYALDRVANAMVGLQGGAGGGGGGGHAATAGGGGGGAGGGIVVVAAKTLILVNSGQITANGGAGGDGAVAGNAGGGGSGSGGCVSVVYETFQGLSSLLRVFAGLEGFGSGTGINGVQGAVGQVYEYQTV